MMAVTKRGVQDAAVLPAGVGGVAPASRVGGMALMNGLILVSERHWAAAIRDVDGGITTASGRKLRIPVGGRDVSGGGGIPLVRGLARMAESLLVLAEVKMKLPGAESPLQGKRVMAALAASAGATSLVKTVARRSAIAQEVGSALAAFVPAVLAVKNSPIAGYHGAEHKIIGGMEADPAQSGMEAAKEHDRCGSNLIGPYLLATVAINLLARGRSGKKSPVASALAGAAGLGVALEVLRWTTTHGDSLLARVLLLPGRVVQKSLTTREPSDDQLEVARRALEELLQLEGAAV